MNIFGILNLTPDSFFDGGKYKNVESAIHAVKEMIRHKVWCIDIGGESTRPGAEPVSIEEELQRVLPIITAIQNLDVRISIDTYKSEVAERAICSGAKIINDISGLRFDPDMVKVAAKYKVPVIIMHIHGTPKTMQKTPKYHDVVKEVFEFFEEKIDYAQTNGIQHDNIIIDPGIGFGKDLEHNIQLIQHAHEFRKLGCPLLYGVSRKSFIGKILDRTVNERLAGSLASTAFLFHQKVEYIRVHDTKETADLIQLLSVLYPTEKHL